jgi:hypothetical protein
MGLLFFVVLTLLSSSSHNIFAAPALVCHIGLLPVSMLVQAYTAIRC